MKRIRPTSGMDDETFVKHFNARHMPMAGMTELHESVLTQSPEVLASFRAFHKHVHRREKQGLPKDIPPLEHYHGKAK